MLKDFFDAEQIFCYRELPVSALSLWDEKKFQRMEESIGKVVSAVIFLIPYFAGQRTTNLSVYAQPRDYHLYLKELSARFADYLETRAPHIRFCGFTDSSPIREREAALAAGLGVQGKNGVVLNERYGSWFFIGEFFLTESIFPQEPVAAEACMGCGACLKACPTGAVTDPQRTRCLSLITQKKELTPEEEALLSAATCKWGCDLCQLSCPYNEGAQETPIPFFREGHVRELTEEAALAPKGEFLTRAYSWRGRRVLLRNIENKKD